MRWEARYHVIQIPDDSSNQRGNNGDLCNRNEPVRGRAPTVFATAVPDSAPTIFRPAAIKTATLGVKTLVDTDVAIALAVS